MFPNKYYNNLDAYHQSKKVLWWKNRKLKLRKARRRRRRRRKSIRKTMRRHLVCETAGTLCTCHYNISSSQHFLDHVTRHAVEKKSQHGQQQQSRDNLDGQPLVLVADQVFHSFERSEEPQQAGVWAAGEKIIIKKKHHRSLMIQGMNCMLNFP